MAHLVKVSCIEQVDAGINRGLNLFSFKHDENLILSEMAMRWWPPPGEDWTPMTKA